MTIFTKKKKIKFTDNFALISEVDLIVLCVPTPLSKNKLPDLSYIKETLLSINDHLREYQTLSLESTTYPGTTREIIYPIIKKNLL